jgi:amino acid transporter
MSIGAPEPPMATPPIAAPPIAAPDETRGGPDHPKRMRREASRTALLFFSVGGIIGSGWLLGPMFAAQIAGPAALISWVIGGVAVAIIALTIAELGTMFPLAGGLARYPHFAFGGLVGYLVGWLAWLGFTTTSAGEVSAAMQYASNYLPWLVHRSGGQVVLSGGGYAIAAGLMIVFAAINIMGVRSLLRVTTYAGWWKIAVPVIAACAILALTFHTHNLTGYGGFVPFGTKGIFLAIPTGGIIYAYLGFEQAAVLAGEGRNPARNVPFAVLGSLALCIVIYLLLQVAFLLGIGPVELRHGWANLDVKGFYGPFAALTTTLGLAWVSVLLYIDAVVSPGACSLVYVGSSARTSYAMARNFEINAGPLRFTLSKRGVPVTGILLAAVVGMLALLPLPSWQQIIGFVTSAEVMLYAFMPLAFVALRRQLPNADRPYRLLGRHAFGADVLAFLGFIIANFIIYWSGWETDWKLLIAIVIGLLILVPRLVGKKRAQANLEVRRNWWLLPYLVGLGVVSYLGSFGGGRAVIPFGWDFLVVIAFSAVIFLLALRSRLPVEGVEQNVQATGWDE